MYSQAYGCVSKGKTDVHKRLLLLLISVFIMIALYSRWYPPGTSEWSTCQSGCRRVKMCSETVCVVVPAPFNYYLKLKRSTGLVAAADVPRKCDRRTADTRWILCVAAPCVPRPMSVKNCGRNVPRLCPGGVEWSYMRFPRRAAVPPLYFGDGRRRYQQNVVYRNGRGGWFTGESRLAGVIATSNGCAVCRGITAVKKRHRFFRQSA